MLKKRTKMIVTAVCCLLGVISPSQAKVTSMMHSVTLPISNAKTAYLLDLSANKITKQSTEKRATGEVLLASNSDLLYSFENGQPRLTIGAQVGATLGAMFIKPMAKLELKALLKDQSYFNDSDFKTGHFLIVKNRQGNTVLVKITAITERQLSLSYLILADNKKQFNLQQLALFGPDGAKSISAKTTLYSVEGKQANVLTLASGISINVKPVVVKKEPMYGFLDPNLVASMAGQGDLFYSKGYLYFSHHRGGAVGGGLLVDLIKESDLDLYSMRDYYIAVKKDTRFILRTPQNNFAIGRILSITPEKVQILWLYNNDGTALFSAIDEPPFIRNQQELDRGLLNSAKRGTLEDVKKILLAGANINALDFNGNSVLMKSIMSKNEEIPLWLIQQGADIHYINPRYGDASIHLAADYGLLGVIKVLVEKGVDPTIKSNYGTVYETAIDRGRQDMIDYLTSIGVGPDSVFTAIKSGDSDLVNKMLNQGGIDLAAQNGDGYTALQLAAEYGHANLIKLLLEEGADITAESKTQNSTPLVLATLNDKPEAVAVLVTEVTSQADKVEALQYATNQQSLAVIKVLLQAGVDAHAHRNGLKSPFEFAMEVADKDVIALYRQYGYKPTFGSFIIMGNLAVVENKIEEDLDLLNYRFQGDTVLDLAIKSGHIDIAKYFIDLGITVNPKVSNRMHNAPLHYAIAARSMELTVLLLENGANLKAKDKFHRKPLVSAISAGYPAVITLLLEWGAMGSLDDKEKRALKESIKNTSYAELFQGY